MLDNLEQVVGVAPDLDQLLARCPGLEILATSRTVLRLRAEREYRVGPLTVPVFSGRAPIEELASLPAVQLFVDRARAVRYDFALTDDNALAVVEICRRLDGLPLAIELAAARARLLEPEALLARLGSRLDALGTGPVDLPERQRTLRATVEWSVGLLDDAEQHMLATLSIFVEGWTVEAAAHVSGLTEDRTLDLLDSLAGHSLVSVDATEAGPRFRMLAAIGELAAERLAAGADLADVERRHAEYFGALVENADWPAERQTEWAERLRTEEGNLGVAIRWFFTHDIAPLPHIFLILCRHDLHAPLFWQVRDRMPEGRAWIQELLLRADALEDRVQAELLLISAVTAVEVGDDDSAQSAVEAIQRLEGRIDDPYLESAAQLAVSWILPIVDDFDGALQAASTALDGFREQNEPFMAWAALTVGLLEMTLGRRRRRAGSPHRGQRARRPVRQQVARAGCTNTTRLARCAGGPTRAGSSAAGGVGRRERGHRAQHPNRDLLSRRLCPARSGGKRSYGGPRWPWARSMGCASARDCGRGHRCGAARRNWPPEWRRRSIPTSSRTPSQPDPSSTNVKRSPSCAATE